jgi:hypothetical protein
VEREHVERTGTTHDRLQQDNLIYRVNQHGERAEVGQEAGKTSTFILDILPAGVSRRRLQSCHFRVTESCVVMDRQSSQ